jgi:hypothetical protein
MPDKFTFNTFFILGTLFFCSFALADTPPTLTEHSHAITVSGKLTFFRSQMKGLEIGPGNDRLDAEVLVGLDSQPGNIYGVRLHEDEPSAAEMITTLREAYLRKIPVTIQVPVIPGRKNLNIFWVQLGK